MQSVHRVGGNCLRRDAAVRIQVNEIHSHVSGDLFDRFVVSAFLNAVLIDAARKAFPVGQKGATVNLHAFVSVENVGDRPPVCFTEIAGRERRRERAVVISHGSARRIIVDAH